MGGVKKEYRPLPGIDTVVLDRAVSTFAAFPRIRHIIITVPDSPETGEAAARRALSPELLAGEQPKIGFVTGGSTRRESVHRALAALSTYSPDYVLIHDGCRPFISARLIQLIMGAVQKCGAVIPLLPLIDTPKEINIPLDDDFFTQVDFSADAGPSAIEAEVLPVVTRHMRRDFTGLAQTPQGFAFAEILAAHEKAAERERAGLCEYTDDAQVWGEFCGPVAVVPGSPENRKITFPADLED
jgi:2-C-methyl-D-erythritol 4-phosphate cytidylyltransferase